MDAKTESGSRFSLLNSCMATPAYWEPGWRRDVGRLAGSAGGVSAGVVVDEGLVWAAWEGLKGVCWFPAGWGGQSGRGEALSQLQLLSLGLHSHLFHYHQEMEFLTPGWENKLIFLCIPGSTKDRLTCTAEKMQADPAQLDGLLLYGFNSVQLSFI